MPSVGEDKGSSYPRWGWDSPRPMSSMRSRLISWIGPAPARCWRQRGRTIPARDAGRGVGDTARMEYVSRVPRPPLDGLIDDLYYLEGAPPYARLTLPPSPAAFLIVNLGAPFRIRAGTDIEAAEYADGVVVTTPTRALEFGYPPGTRSVGVHFKPWGLAPFLSMPAAELCDRPVTVEEVWSRPTVAELRDRLATATGPHEMLTLLEDQLMRLVGRDRRPGAGPPHEQCHRGGPPEQWRSAT